MSDILFLAHRIPYPPDKGDKIRSWHLLKFLAERATVHLGAFVDDPADMAHADKLRAICGEVLLQPLARTDRWRRGLRGLARGEALSLALYHDPAMAAWVERILRERRIGGVFAFSSQMAPYALPNLAGRRSVMDFVDVDSEKWRQYAAEAGPGVRRMIYNREADRLRAFEKQAARRFDVSLFVSEAEAALFRNLVGPDARAVLALSNGVDFGYFDPRAAFEPLPASVAPTIMFSGAMDYRPNVDAVIWFARTIWPRVRAARPQAVLQIVGARPSAEVTKLDGRDGIAVTGRVADMRPHLAAADVVVAPLRIARGIQNKILEAMAMARPVVATAAAFEGIDAVPGEHLVVEDEPVAYADRLLELLDKPLRARAIGAAARRRVTERYAWSANLAVLDRLLDLAAPAAYVPSRAVAE